MLASLLGVTITNGFFSVIDFYWVLTHDLWLQAQSSDYYAMTASFCMPTDNHNHLCVLVGLMQLLLEYSRRYCYKLKT